MKLPLRIVMYSESCWKLCVESCDLLKICENLFWTLYETSCHFRPQEISEPYLGHPMRMISGDRPCYSRRDKTEKTIQYLTVLTVKKKKTTFK